MNDTIKSITSPKKFLVGKGFLPNLPTYTEMFGKKVYIIADAFIADRVRKETMTAYTEAGQEAVVVTFGGENTREEISKHRDFIRIVGADVIIGIGGGKAMDTAKATAYFEKRPVVIFPTIASTDAPTTALSVIYKENGEFDEYLFLPQNPDVVIADTEILSTAPTRFFVAGIGDALATYFEARACYNKQGHNLVNMKPTFSGLGLAKMCYDTIKEFGYHAKLAVDQNLATPAVERTIEATIFLSGVGAEAGGLAAAHAINNGMSFVPSLHNTQHGEKVTFGTLSQLILEGAPTEEIEEVYAFCHQVGLPITFSQLGLDAFRETEWRLVAKQACAPGDSMDNQPHPVTEEDVYQAMVMADILGQAFLAKHSK